MPEWFLWIDQGEAWIALLTLTILEIVLGIDNIVLISVLSNRLPKEQQAKARTIGLGLALAGRLLLLFAISWVMSLTETLFAYELAGIALDISGKDLILIGGGLFLLGKAVHEIHSRLEGGESEGGAQVKTVTFAAVIGQVLILDIVFSLDSVVTAVGMAKHVPVMVIAMVVAVGVMMISAGAVSRFIERHPTVQMLALSFLLLIGFTLVAEGMGQHISKGYVYFAMGFSVLVEMLNLRIKSKRRVSVRHPRVPEGATANLD